MVAVRAAGDLAGERGERRARDDPAPLLVPFGGQPSAVDPAPQGVDADPIRAAASPIRYVCIRRW
ncbi:hypothetical protein SVIO_058190 [Streptomyces violaceusniger]|uniref:Uncharacterized protein n=1 Tax=Streptomyces violaceusniger TaxID=68280 RepID=A0A4D4L7M8_STRVO|nr:hypothetical protein SVIO_058190 [Streptomyces violaceusniger]